MKRQTARQTARVEARRAARAAQRQMLSEQKERERRLGALGVQVADALAEREASVRAAELRASEALRGLVEDEGMPLREALAWCGVNLSMREAHRLRRLVQEEETGAGDASVERIPEEEAGSDVGSGSSGKME